MTELQNQSITLKRPVGRSQFQPTIASDMQKPALKPLGEQAESTSYTKGNRRSLELYEGTGQVRSEQPAARGTNIDITV